MYSYTRNNTIFNDRSWLRYLIQGRLNEERSLDSAQLYMPFYLKAEDCLLNIEKGYPKKPNNRNDIWFAKLEVNYRITNSITKNISQNKMINPEDLKYYVGLLTRPNSLFVHTHPTDRQNIPERTTIDFVLRLCVRDFKTYILYYEPFYKAKYSLAKILFEQKKFELCSNLLFNSNKSKIDRTVIHGLFELSTHIPLMKVMKTI